MSGDLINTILGLLIAVVLVSIGWSMAMYFFELYNLEGTKEYKTMLINSVSGLVLLLFICGIVDWVRAWLGTYF